MSQVNTEQIRATSDILELNSKLMASSCAQMKSNVTKLKKAAESYNKHDNKRATKLDDITIEGSASETSAFFKVIYESYEIPQISPQSLAAIENIGNCLEELEERIEELRGRNSKVDTSADTIDEERRKIEGELDGDGIDASVSAQPEGSTPYNDEPNTTNQGDYEWTPNQTGEHTTTPSTDTTSETPTSTSWTPSQTGNQTQTPTDIAPDTTPTEPVTWTSRQEGTPPSRHDYYEDEELRFWQDPKTGSVKIEKYDTESGNWVGMKWVPAETAQRMVAEYNKRKSPAPEREKKTHK